MEKPKVVKRKLKKVKKNKDVIEPLLWTPLDRQSFHLNQTFLPLQITEESLKKKRSGLFEPTNIQKLIRDYMTENSPYRGVLLYHKLGSGKTCSAIGVSENLNRKTIVILPKSLENNFIGTPGKEGLKFCGNPLYRGANGDKLINKRYSFVSSDAYNTLDQIKRLGNLDNHTVIIDEVHNLISMMVNEGKQGREIYQMFMKAKNIKIVALSGTPIRNKAYEAGVLCNILRGPIEMLRFRYTENLNPQVETELMKVKEVDYVEVDSPNKIIKVHITTPSWHSNFRKVLRNVIKTSPIPIKLENIDEYTLFPEDEEEFMRYFISQKSLKNEKFKNESIFKSRAAGLISYFAGTGKENYPEVRETNEIKLDMSAYQFSQYRQMRAIELATERGGSSKGKKRVLSRRTSSQASVSSTMRQYSRQYCDFVFPEEIPRPFKKSMVKKNKNEVVEEENESKIVKKYESNIARTLKKLYDEEKLI